MVGAEVLGPLPGDLNSVVVFVAGIEADSKNADVARAGGLLWPLHHLIDCDLGR